MGQALQLGQQGSDYGQYGQTSMSSPYGMNEIADANAQQNQNTQNTNDYSPMLPQSTLTQGQQPQWYPGMYPSSQPQFGSNPYAPQTFNLQGHPGLNPTRIPNIEPNQPNDAYSNQGQFQQVRTMAEGGDSSTTDAPKLSRTPFNDPNAARWQGYTPSLAPAISGYTYDPSAGYYTNDQGKGFLPSYVGNNPLGAVVNTMGNFGKGRSTQNTSLGNGWYMTPVGKNYTPSSSLFKGPAKVDMQPAPVTPANTAIYQPQYTQPKLAYNPNIDSMGNPLYNSGGLASIPRK